MKVVIAGGSGFLGRALVARFRAHHRDVVVLSRGGGNAPDGARVVNWSPDGSAAAAAWAEEIDGADAVVNLAGAGIADRRWTAARKRLLRDSRVLGTRSLVAAVRAARRRPTVFIQQSAIGIYGTAGDDVFDERTHPGSDFLAGLCAEWEREAGPLSDLGCRVVCLRTGLVLSRAGGALSRMLPAFRFFAGGPIASGRQYMSWIHLDDWVSMVAWAIDTTSAVGAINATAPQPVPNAEFARALGGALHRPSWIPVPAFVLRLLFGEMADALLIRGQRVLPARARQLGFKFSHQDISGALASALR